MQCNCPRDLSASAVSGRYIRTRKFTGSPHFFVMLHIYRSYGEGGGWGVGGGSVDFARFPELFHGNKLEQRWGSVGMLGFCRNTNTFYSAKCPSFRIPLASFTL